jgi:hypothetical protein
MVPSQIAETLANGLATDLHNPGRQHEADLETVDEIRDLRFSEF